MTGPIVLFDESFSNESYGLYILNKVSLKLILEASQKIFQ